MKTRTRFAIYAGFALCLLIWGASMRYAQSQEQPPDICWFGTKVCHMKNDYCPAYRWEEDGQRIVLCQFLDTISTDNGWVARKSDGWCRIKPKCKHKGGPGE
jgi:hypothetical protein